MSGCRQRILATSPTTDKGAISRDIYLLTILANNQSKPENTVTGLHRVPSWSGSRDEGKHGWRFSLCLPNLGQITHRSGPS
jgi:hypothetical protein